ncbi:MAG: methyltransferase domain-containing protein [Oligoflexia bacterium]|nr:methyltransferase domain-containing protein [Oligoflexia bacterium]
MTNNLNESKIALMSPLYQEEKSEVFLHDIEWTKENRDKLGKNKNLLYWYEKLYLKLFEDLGDIANLAVLEIGSGTSPIKIFYPSIITSDVMPLPYLDHCFDVHDLGLYDKIKDESLDVVVMTNVLHHLQNPLIAMEQISKKIKPSGRVIIVEPFFSIVSKFVFTKFHHEKMDFDVVSPCLENVSGPLTSANMALPYKIFFMEHSWQEQVGKVFFISYPAVFFSSLSYMMTGGISRSFPINRLLYKVLFKIDAVLAKFFPHMLASFFCINLKRRD